MPEVWVAAKPFGPAANDPANWFCWAAPAAWANVGLAVPTPVPAKAAPAPAACCEVAEAAAALPKAREVDFAVPATTPAPTARLELVWAIAGALARSETKAT